MEKKFLNFIYWILLKSAESYYGASIKTEIPYTPYFQKILFDEKLERFTRFKNNHLNDLINYVKSELDTKKNS